MRTRPKPTHGKNKKGLRTGCRVETIHSFYFLFYLKLPPSHPGISIFSGVTFYAHEWVAFKGSFALLFLTFTLIRKIFFSRHLFSQPLLLSCFNLFNSLMGCFHGTILRPHPLAIKPKRAHSKIFKL